MPLIKPYYPRVRIHGTLTCISDLHVGSGEELDWDASKRRVSPTQQGFYSGVCIATDGKPYLPASTLRGFLRSVAEQNFNQATTKTLFGFAEGDQGNSGKLRVFDATIRTPAKYTDNNLFWSEPRASTIRFGVAIDPVTQTADAHKLFQHEIIPKSSVFQLTLEADNLDEHHLSVLSAMLKQWDGSLKSAIGKGVSKGLGRLQWHEERVEVLEHEGLWQWLASDQALDESFKVLTESPKPIALPSTSTSTLQCRLLIYPESPFLVHDPAYVKLKQDEADHTIDHEFSRLPDGRAMLPASSLRGLARGRAGRILATLALSYGAAAAEARSLIEPLLQTLFGQTGERSPIWFGDAETSSSGTHEQTFNAVDRFTGGVADGKLYQVNAAESNRLTCSISLEEQRLPSGNWWKGLLLLVLRDAMESDLAIGWGKAKGFGAFHTHIELADKTVLKNWSELLRYLENSDQQTVVESWLDALHDKLERTLRANKGEAA